jgi:adenosine deaminase
MRDVQKLPKAELHLHVEGTLEPEMAVALAARNGVELPWPDVDELRAQYDFSDLQSFLDVYYACMAALREPADFRDLIYAYCERAVAQGVRHAEVFFDPQAHTARGVPIDAVLDGLLAGLRDARETFGLTGGLILCLLRDRPAAEALETLESVRQRTSDLLGIGLDSAEVGHPPSKFTEVYALARELGLHVVAHAGEEGPPAYVWEALDVLKVERIDHGVRSLEDPALVERLVADRIPLTVCPLSNLRLRVVDKLADHPLPAMLAAGLVATVNSDDPAYFGGYAGENFAAIRENLQLSDDDLRTLAANSVAASFADDDRKAELLAQITQW